ncbi:permease-like cell division protein FtsX [Streptosporangium subroseum]|uniref:permease-like cell division protein FtsX n=1 Tax=Streptosporangium subroseum TaxID=106412 RepID=UPI0011801AA0|nr:permease-like cell division protein FtsX [Streptosporangium subroseum]
MALGATGAAAAEAEGRHVRQGLIQVSPPPAGPWPQDGVFDIYLCMNGDILNNCRNRTITPKQKRTIEARLRAMPEVAEVRFESQKKAYANFRKQNPDNKALLSALQVDDMPESFKGRLHRRADIVPIRSTFEKMAGVSNVFTLGGSFWEGKADVEITLCGPGEASGTCDGHDGATPWDKERIEARLGTVEGVEKVYFEDSEHAAKVFSFWWMRKASDPQGFPESYYVKLADPGDAQVLIDTVKVMSGVSSARIVDDGW